MPGPHDLRAAILAIVAEVKQRVEESWRAMEDRDLPLYHYTSQAGLLGNLNSQVLFATDARF